MRLRGGLDRGTSLEMPVGGRRTGQVTSGSMEAPRVVQGSDGFPCVIYFVSHSP